jgi:polysaccharide export outer membrane protein
MNPFGVRTVSIVSAGTKTPQQVNLGEALSGSAEANLPVRPGDIVTVSSVRLLSVYVLGKVALPGLKLVRLDHAGILEVISMAGGTTVDAVSSGIRITHLDGTIEMVDLVPVLFKGPGKTDLPSVRAGDVIVVPESLQKIAVLGLVKTPGVFPLQDGRPVTLADAIALAQGPDVRRARLSRVGLMRVQPDGKAIHYTINFGDYLRKGDPKLNPLLKPGDIVYVPETNSIDWSVILGSVSTFSNLYYNYSILHP